MVVKWVFVIHKCVGNFSIVFLFRYGSQDSLISIVTSQWVEWSGVRTLQQAADFSLLQNMLTGPGIHPVTYAVGLMWG
jgi:hypothetical protein